MDLSSLAHLLALFAFSDPLFERMQGTWVAEGERHQLASGARIRIHTDTHATIEGARLLSRNRITETNASGNVKVYTRTYWVQRDPSGSGRYNLGMADEVTSQGAFVDGILEVNQDLGGEPALSVRSRTRFDDSGSLYEETAWLGDRQLSRTRIRYVPAPR